MEKKWYVIHTYSGYENRVKAALEERVKLSDKQDCFSEIIIPTENIVEVVKGEKKTSLRKFFPGYVLVNMVMNNETWHIVRHTPKVTGFLGGGKKPVPIPDERVRGILQQISEGKMRPKQKFSFDKGDSVRIIEGPFANFNGVVDEVKPEKGRVKVLVSIFGRSTPIELEFLQVKKN
jgi:transcriptional antiterminator NusG